MVKWTLHEDMALCIFCMYTNKSNGEIADCLSKWFGSNRSTKSVEIRKSLLRGKIDENNKVHIPPRIEELKEVSLMVPQIQTQENQNSQENDIKNVIRSILKEEGII